MTRESAYEAVYEAAESARNAVRSARPCIEDPETHDEEADLLSAVRRGLIGRYGRLALGGPSLNPKDNLVLQRRRLLAEINDVTKLLDDARARAREEGMDREAQTFLENARREMALEDKNERLKDWLEDAQERLRAAGLEPAPPPADERYAYGEPAYEQPAYERHPYTPPAEEPPAYQLPADGAPLYKLPADEDDVFADEWPADEPFADEAPAAPPHRPDMRGPDMRRPDMRGPDTWTEDTCALDGLWGPDNTEAADTRAADTQTPGADAFASPSLRGRR